MNHTIDECYSKHGYPPWIKQRQDLANQDKEGNNQSACNLNIKEDSTQNVTQNAKLDYARFTLEQIQKLIQIIEHTDKPGHNVNQLQRKDSDVNNHVA